MRYLFLPLVMLVTVILASGCAAPARKTLITSLNMEFGADSLLSGKTGAPVSYAEMLKDMADSRVIYIGENHTDPVHHRIQLQVIQDLAARHQTAVGVEMIDHSYQPVLDKWSQGELSEQDFLEKIHWYANWRYNFDLYRGIFETVREQAHSPHRTEPAISHSPKNRRWRHRQPVARRCRTPAADTYPDRSGAPRLC